MKNFDFDLCAIPILGLVIFTYFYRRIWRYREYRYFFAVAAATLVCAVLDVAMEYTVNPLPLSSGRVALGYVCSFSYKVIRNSCMVLYLLFIAAFSKTEYQVSTTARRLALWTPYALLVVLLIQNFFTGNVFSVTQAAGYARGPLLGVLYAVAGLYEVLGMAYLAKCRKLLDFDKWAALLSVYVLIALSVVAQALNASLMLEIFCTAIGLLTVALVVLRPEDTIDSSVGAQNWKSFQSDLRHLLVSKQHGEILALRLEHASESRDHLGDERYAACVAQMLDDIHAFANAANAWVRVYYEEPECIYIILREYRGDLVEFARGCQAAANGSSDDANTLSVRRTLVLRTPEDLSDADHIINLCHRFPTLSTGDEVVQAADIVNLRDFEAWNHVAEILDRAVNSDTLHMYYQPIYDLKERRFRSAEALARIIDPEFGFVSPLVFIPAAERSGAILPLGRLIVEQVFRFLSEHDLDALGISYIEINLSVEQLLQHDLPDTIAELRERYGVDPANVNFEVTETVMGQMGGVLEDNLARLVEAGYTLSLDDYGTGYSNIQRLKRLPLSIIKVDKSLTDDLFKTDGVAIMRGTVSMMHDIGQELVVEGVETREALGVLEDLSCDYIQGYYFSKPLDEEHYVKFLRKQ